MRRSLRILVVVTVWSVCTGSHWDVLQVIAWAKMFASNTEEMSYREAAARTFAPEEACELCAFVATAKQDEQADPLLGPSNKEKPPLIVDSVEPPLVGLPNSSEPWNSEAPRIWRPLDADAPTPPPRLG